MHARIDVWINNAGVAFGKDFMETSEEEYDLMFDVNVKGLWKFMKEVSALMIAKKFGRIINIGSGVGKHGSPGLSIYSATKHAVIGLSDSAHGSSEIRNLTSLNYHLRKL